MSKVRAMESEREARLIERTAQIAAHRGCCGSEHDPANGKLHGYCVVCGVPWPCAYAGKPPQNDALSAREDQKVGEEKPDPGDWTVCKGCGERECDGTCHDEKPIAQNGGETMEWLTGGKSLDPDPSKNWAIYKSRAESADSTLRLLREELEKLVKEWQSKPLHTPDSQHDHGCRETELSCADQLSALVQKFGVK